MKRKTLRTLFLAAVAALGFCRVAQSTLRVDLRVTSVGGPATLTNSQSVVVAGVGAQIHVDIWAHITGTNGQLFDEGLTSLSGSLLSWQNDFGNYVRGDLSASLLPSFSAPGSSVGTQIDLDGDGGLDVGSNDDPHAGRFFAVRALSASNPVAGSEIRIGRATFEVSQLTSSIGEAFLSFYPRYSNTAALWLEDGIVKRPGAGDGWFTWGDGVAVSAIPEPSALAILSAVASFASALRPQRRK
ncbi:hypothetical protein BH09PLA1_BH09PLA1_32340 [soil metagenome]